MFFLSGKNGFNVCLSLKLISLLKKCICLVISLFFLRHKVCKISLQHTKDVKLLPGTYLANSFVNRGKKCTFQWHTNKIPKFMNRRKRFEIPIKKKNSPGYEGKKGTVAQAPLIVATYLATCQFTHPVLGKVTARSARPRCQGADHWKKYIIMNYIM